MATASTTTALPPPPPQTQIDSQSQSQEPTSLPTTTTPSPILHTLPSITGETFTNPAIPGFYLTAAHPSEARILMDLLDFSWANDAIWSRLFIPGEIVQEEKIDWLVANFGKRFQLPNNVFWVVREGSAQGKIVAWTSLWYPGTMNAEQQALNDKTTPFPKGLNEPLWNDFVSLIGRTTREKKYGYDASVHFHRKGTMTHPSYQRRGIATWMTQHCNEIADRHGTATYVGARPSSRKLFSKTGFVKIGEESMDLSKYGVGEGEGPEWVLKREVGGKGSSSEE